MKDILIIGEIELNIPTRTVNVAGRTALLTRTECAIMKTLMQHPNTVVSKNALLEKISEDTPDCTESSLKMHISNLRKKLKTVHSDPIKAIWRIGFKLTV